MIPTNIDGPCSRCGHTIDYSEQDELVNESLARGEHRSELPVPDEA